MAPTLDPSFTIKPILTGMKNPQPSLICCATGGPDDPENVGIDSSSFEPVPEPTTSDRFSISSFAAFSSNIPRGTPPLQQLTYSHDGKIAEFNVRLRSLSQLARASVDSQTGIRRAILIDEPDMPFELSSMLYSAGQREYVRQHVDQIIFCPVLVLMDESLENVVHVPDIAIYVLEDIGSERKLLINLFKPTHTDGQGVTELVPRHDYEIFPDIIDGALRLHMMGDVMNGNAPRVLLDVSYLRARSHALQIPALDAVMKIQESRGLRGGKAHTYLGHLRRKLAMELVAINL